MKIEKKVGLVLMILLVFTQSGFCAGFQKVDVDLSRLSGIMVYSEVYNMMFEPEKYAGKTVRMKGMFYAVTEDRPRPVFACIVQDATACCMQGLEFRLKGNYKYPKDYPPIFSEITVVGTFFYENDGWFVNIGLKDAVLEAWK